MILLDTHTLLWLDQGLAQLGLRARETANRALREDRLAISAVSFWEAAVLVERGRVELDKPTEVWRQELLQSGLIEVSLDGRIAITAIGLPGLHGDPADRFIAATALLNEACLITADRRLLNWSGPLDCLDARA